MSFLLKLELRLFLFADHRVVGQQALPIFRFLHREDFVLDIQVVSKKLVNSAVHSL